MRSLDETDIAMYTLIAVGILYGFVSTGINQDIWHPREQIKYHISQIEHIANDVVE